MTQEVQTVRSNPIKLDLGFTPGRRQANKVISKISIYIIQKYKHNFFFF